MTRFFRLAALATVILLSTTTVRSDSDEPPLFVASGGADTGNCEDAQSPCQTIQYALNRVGKNGRIRVGVGSFELSNVADVIYMLSGSIDVRGISRPTLVGVPPEFAGELEAKGFRIIADSKGLHQTTVQTQLALKTNAPATACVGGFAGDFPCDNVDLLSHVANRSPLARGADIWGFLDLNTNREYTVVGYSWGITVFDVTDPEEPRDIGSINGQSTTWRDIKIHQLWNTTDKRWNAYAYVTADNTSDGLIIIDLTELPHRISRVNYTSDFSEAHNVYILDTDFSTGLSITSDSPNLILAGSNLSGGRFRTYGLSDATSPSFIAAPQTPNDQPSNDRLYIHDGASMVVTDARKDSQCVNAGGQGHCDILFDFNESSVDIWDVTSPQNPSRLSRMPYSNSAYTHSGWPTEDQQYLFIQDELDERDNGLFTTLRVLSISDLTAPSIVGTWTGPTRAIDHNGFVRGNRYYMSNYSRGLTVLDISDPENPVSAGRFDTFPASDASGFPGNWGVYPFLPSGNIALSDIDSGFFMVADNTLDVPQGSLSFSTASFAADETETVDIVVQRSGGTQGSASVTWQIIAATGGFDDVATSRGVLNWAAGDGSDRTINLGLTNDGAVEGLERILVKLIAPTGGATIASPSLASAYLNDPGDTSSVQFSTDSINVGEQGFGTAVAVVQRTGNANGAMSVDYNVNPGDATSGSDFAGPANGSISWADGDADPKWIEYTISDDATAESIEFFEVALSNISGGSIGNNTTLRVNIVDGDGSNSAPNSVAGASQTVAGGATVTLDGSGSNDPEGNTLTYAWSQTLGPNVSISNPSSATASFVAPTVNSDTLMRFQLQVTDISGLVDTSIATVTVSTNSIGFNGGGGGTIGLWVILGLGLLGICRLSRRDAP
jgi:choice-of-anchor B domain-containing protein